LAVLLLPLVTGCEPSPRGGVATPELPDQEVRAFTLVQSVDGKRHWRLTAASAATYRERGVIVARDIGLDFYDEEGRIYSHLTAREGEVATDSNDMTARGNVVVTTENETRIETESLRYLTSRKEIVSDDLVTVTRGGDVLSGIGFRSDPSLEQFEFRERVRAQVQAGGDRGGNSGP
jgi:LPS export ABC transporter protein LptC